MNKNEHDTLCLLKRHEQKREQVKCSEQKFHLKLIFTYTFKKADFILIIAVPSSTRFHPRLAKTPERCLLNTKWAETLRAPCRGLRYRPTRYLPVASPALPWLLTQLAEELGQAFNCPAGNRMRVASHCAAQVSVTTVLFLVSSSRKLPQ